MGNITQKVKNLNQVFEIKQRPILGLVLGVKCILLVSVWLVASFYPHLYSQGAYYENFHWSQETPSLKSWFETWDGMHYLYLSQHGYAANHPTAAFYPLWPFLIRAGSVVLAGHSLIAALVLSNLLSCLGLWMLHDWMSRKDRPLADVTLLLILAYPGSLFFMFAYTESLFLFLSISFFVFLMQRKYWMTALVSFFLPLTRSVGVLSMIPLIYDVGSLTGLPLQPLWWALTLGADIGGNLTIVGASANVVVSGMATREGHRIGFWEYMKAAVGVTVVGLVLSTGYLYFRYLIPFS